MIYDLTRASASTTLNETASFVFVLCTGTHDAARIAEAAGGRLGASADAARCPRCSLASEQLRDEGLIQ